MNPRIVNVTSCALNSSCLSLPKPKPMLMFLAPHSCFSSSSDRRPSFSMLHSNLSPSRRYLTLTLTKSGRPLMFQPFISPKNHQSNLTRSTMTVATAFSSSRASSFAFHATDMKIDPLYEVGELFELGIQLSYLLLLLALLGAGSFFVIRQVLVRRELDLSAKELQEQVRSGDASATELFELGAVMLRRKYYPASTKFLLQAIDKWDGDEQDLAQVYNALGVSYVRDGKLEKGIAQFEKAVKIQPGYVTAWNNLGDAYEQQKDMKSALKAFEEVLLFDPNNKVARPRVDSLRELVNMYKGVPKGVPSHRNICCAG